MSKQETLIDALRRDGHDITQAKAILESLKQSQSLHVQNRQRILNELDGPQDDPEWTMDGKAANGRGLFHKPQTWRGQLLRWDRATRYARSPHLRPTAIWANEKVVNRDGVGRHHEGLKPRHFDVTGRANWWSNLLQTSL